MEKELKKLKSFFIQKNADDDFADKLSHSYSCMLLLFFAFLISAKSYVGKPIQCWVPKHFTGAWSKYTNNYCWINNTYYLPFDEHIPKEGEVNDAKHMIPYYQWVPIILLMMALFFMLPYYITWRRISSRAGLRLPYLVEAAKLLEALPLRNLCLDKVKVEKPVDDVSTASTSDNEDPQASTSRDESMTSSASGDENVDPPAEEEKKSGKKTDEDLRDDALDSIVYRINRYLSRSRNQQDNSVPYKSGLMRLACCRRLGKSREGQFITTLFIVTKFLYLANAVTQLFALDFFLGHSFSMYGVEVLMALSQGKDWAESYRFPRITQCNLKTRLVGNVQRYTVQCVLPNNLFNEKIFLIIWFWLVFVIAVTILGIFSAIMRNAFKGDRYRFLKRFFRRGRMQEELNNRLESRPVPSRQTSKERSRKFEMEEVKAFEDFLKTDGVFVLRMLEDNTNTVTVAEIIEGLYKRNSQDRMKKALE